MKHLYALLAIIISISGFAQQDPLYTQYIFNPLLINPAYAGINNNFNAMVGYRTQWTGLDGQPQTYYVSAHSSLLDNKIGAGLLIVNDRIGNMTNTESNVLFSYKIESGDNAFSFGMQAGFQNYKTDYSELKIFDQNDNAFLGGEAGSRLNIGAGAVLKGERYFVGFSVPRLLPSNFKNGGQEFELYNRHYYLMGAYVFYLSDRIRLKPTALLRGVSNAPASIDFTFNVNINANHNVGLFTRNLNTYGALLQTTIQDQFKLGYIFEMPTNKSVGTNFNTHEVSLGIFLSVFKAHEDTMSNF